MEAAASEIFAATGKPCVILRPEGADLAIAAAWPPDDRLDTPARAAARWAFEKGEPAGAHTQTLPASGWSFLPLDAPDGRVGALGLELPAAAEPLGVETRTLLAALAEQTAAAIHRALLSTEVRRARTAAETERVRNILLASVSHDFRTPLASILGSATALIEYEDRLEREARQDLLGEIRDEAGRLDLMVRNLLSMTRLEAGALEIRRDWIDVTEALERQVDLARRRGATQRFVIEDGGTRALAFADGVLLDQAIGNIVGNAVRHAGRQAEVRLSASSEGEAVVIRIADDGEGVPAELAPRIFEKFTRAAERPGGDGGDSAGLGLAIAKGIVEAQGGTIALLPPDPLRRGAAFEIRLRSGRGDGMKRPVILVVDDEPAIHRFLKPSLAAEGYDVLQATSGTDALRLAQEEAPDALVLDLGLPDIDGLVVIERLRHVSDVPVVVLSARDREAEKIRALDLGADDYVEKPFGIGELMARLRAALRHRQKPSLSEPYRAGDLSLDLEARIVRKGGAEVKLTRRELALLTVLFQNLGKVVTHRALLREVWGKANEHDTQYLRVYVGHLRQKLEDDPAPRAACSPSRASGTVLVCERLASTVALAAMGADGRSRREAGAAAGARPGWRPERGDDPRQARRPNPSQADGDSPGAGPIARAARGGRRMGAPSGFRLRPVARLQSIGPKIGIDLRKA